MPLEAMSSAPEGLDDFRVSSVREIALVLKQFCDGAEPVTLATPEGQVFRSAIWTLDAVRSTIGFNADMSDPVLQELLERNEAVVVGYLANVKIQFEVTGLVLVHGSRASVLTCAFPREMFRFQRRNAYRVRPLMRTAPVAHLFHDAFSPDEVKLRLIDVSISGCALFLPESFQPPQLGLSVDRAAMDFDTDTRFHVNLRLAHVSSLTSGAGGMRLGFEFVRASGDALRALQRFIDRTQKRGKLMALN